MIAVIGAEGQVGRDVCEEFERQGDLVHRLTHAEMEIGSPDSVDAVLPALKPEVIVNTAAFHQVENCELEAERAFSINACGARNVAKHGRPSRSAIDSRQHGLRV